jgi:hypothetical protein
MPPLAPPGNICNGKFLLELFDDTALFSGLFILIGYFIHAWFSVSKMPNRARTLDSTTQPVETKQVAVVQDSELQPTTNTHTLDRAAAERITRLEEQMSRLISREGRDQGVLGGQTKGRRALSRREAGGKVRQLFRLKSTNSVAKAGAVNTLAQAV